MESKKINCEHLKPVVKWELGKTGNWIPHILCANCNSMIPDSDPVAQYYIEKALGGKEEHENKSQSHLTAA